MSDDGFERFLARQLSFSQWEFLADHFEGPRVIRKDAPNEGKTRMALINKKLIRVHPANAMTPTHTQITEQGHDVMCAALGMMADMLTRAGYDGIKNPTTPKPTEIFGYGKITQGTDRPVDVGNPSLDPLADRDD